jgi:hypothetical protein
VLTLDDILLDDGKVAPFSRSETTYAAMGRLATCCWSAASRISL